MQIEILKREAAEQYISAEAQTICEDCISMQDYIDPNEMTFTLTNNFILLCVYRNGRNNFKLENCFCAAERGQKKQTIPKPRSTLCVFLCSFSQLCREQYISQNIKTVFFFGGEGGCSNILGSVSLFLALEKMSAAERTKQTFFPFFFVRLKLRIALQFIRKGHL